MEITRSNGFDVGKPLVVESDSEAAYVVLQEAVQNNQLDSLLPPTESGAQSGDKATTQLKKATDRSMVRCILTFVAEIRLTETSSVWFSTGSVRWTISQRHSASTHQFLDDFDGVGEKIAPFILQDIALLYRHESLFHRIYPQMHIGSRFQSTP